MTATHLAAPPAASESGAAPPEPTRAAPAPVPEQRTTRTGAQRRATPIVAIAAGVLVLILCLGPVGFIVSAAVEAGPTVIAQVVGRPRVVELLVNTILLSLVVVPACVALGTAGALLVERTRVPQWLAVGFVAPLAVPAFVASYAWATVWPSISGLTGAALVATLSYYPFVFLPVWGTLRRLDPDLEESAAALGLRPREVYVRTILPQLRLPILAGALLVALHLLAEYGAFAFVRFDTFTTAIYDQYKSTFAGPAASMLAGVLVLLSLVVLAGEAVVRGRQRHVRLGSGTSRLARRRGLGRWLLPVWAVVTVLFATSLGVPAYALVRWLGIGAAWDRELVPAVATTLTYAGVAALVTCLAALPVVWLAVRHPSWWSKALESATFVCSSLPGIVVGLAFVALAIRLVPALYQTSAVLVAAYVVLFLPRAVAGLRGGVAQSSRALEESAQSLGCTPIEALRRVTLPILRPALGSAVSLAFLGVAGELTATLLLSPTGTATLATRFWSLASEIDYPGAAPYALLLVALSVPMTVILFRRADAS